MRKEPSFKGELQVIVRTEVEDGHEDLTHLEIAIGDSPLNLRSSILELWVPLQSHRVLILSLVGVIDLFTNVFGRCSYECIWVPPALCILPMSMLESTYGVPLVISVNSP